MHVRALIYLLVFVALLFFIFKKYKAYGSRDEQIERRKVLRDPSSLTPERRKDDDVGGED